MTGEPSVAVIGLGARGLGVLERLVSLCRDLGADRGRLCVEVIDPTCSGRGIHVREQPNYLRLHSPAGKVTMFPDAATLPGTGAGTGPSLLDWAVDRGLTVGPDGLPPRAGGRPVMPSDFLPRSVLGDYLTWVGDHLRRSAPPYVKIVAHRTEAVDIDRDADGRLMVRCADGRTLTVGRAFLTTGYGGGGPPFPDGGRERVRHPYPLPLATAGVRPGETLAVLGFGLSALDLVASVTVGRGGRFTEYGDRLVYLPGGAEPTVLLASRSGVPARCRPPLPVRRPKFRPRFLDVAAIEELRGRPGGQVDFERDALPLVYDEMRLAYRRAQLRGYGPDPDALPTAALRKQLDDWDEELGRFDAAASLAGSANMSLVDGSRYHEWVAEAIRSDLAAARKLPNGTPLKCATEALVDLFQAIQAVLVPGLITDRSLETFSAITGPAIRRAAVGPYHDRQRELLALLDAGVVRAPFGPEPVVRKLPRDGWEIGSTRLVSPFCQSVRWVFAGHMPTPSLDSATSSPLVSSLWEKGWIRRHRRGLPQIRAIDIDHRMHPLDDHGRPDEQLWVLGPLCEDATFYNHVLPEPGSYSPCVADAHRCVSEMLSGGDD